MQKNIFFVFTLFLGLFFSLNVQAAAPVAESLSVGADSCDLPAPTNFHVTGVGSNWVSLAWDQVQGAQSYQLKLYESGTNNLLSTNNVNGTSGIFIKPAGMTVDAHLAAIGERCESPSKHNSIITGIGVIIVDLIAEFGTSSPSLQEVEGSNCFSIPWPNATYWFDVFKTASPQNYNRYEILDGNGSLCTPNARFKKCPQSSKILITNLFSSSNGTWTTAPVSCGHSLQIWDITPGGTPMAIFDVTMTFPSNGAAQICFNQIGPASEGYDIKFWKLVEEFGRPEPRSISESPTLQAFSPFHDHLKVVVPETDEPTRSTAIRLFNVSGQAVRQTITAESGEMYLETADLEPGLYVLQTDNGVQRRNIKVVKM